MLGRVPLRREVKEVLLLADALPGTRRLGQHVRLLARRAMASLPEVVLLLQVAVLVRLVEVVGRAGRQPSLIRRRWLRLLLLLLLLVLVIVVILAIVALRRGEEPGAH